MKEWFQDINQKMRSQGRNGIDGFSCFLFISGFAMLLLACIVKFLWFLGLYAIFPMAWSLIRCFSKKLEKRELEQEAYLSMAERQKENLVLARRRWTDRKTYIYFRCRACEAVMKLPRGKGKVRAVCPECGEPITKKT